MKNIKKILKWSLISIAALAIITLVYMSIPQVMNPSPSYQTELAYGEPISTEIQNLLIPTEEPPRERAIVILKDEKIVFEYGPTDKIMNTASIRKSMMGLLYGIAVDKGLIDINKTLAELNIDEHYSLTPTEKSATVRDLLMAKSGIYIPAQGEHDAQITDRPKRGSRKPGEYFFMNNFDANALGTIFIQETGMDIGEFMEENVAKPIGLQDFSKDNVKLGGPWFYPKKKSMHKQYYIYLSTRDLARIGSVMANEGQWNGKQIVSKEWVRKSTTSYSNLKENHISYGVYDGFGYQWWLASDSNSFWSDGYGGRFLIMRPDEHMVLTEQNFTGNSYLSTFMWLQNRNMDSGFGNLYKANSLIHEASQKSKDLLTKE